MKNRKLFITAAVASAVLLLIVGITTAYLIDTDTKDNVITIGQVSIELDEGQFDPSETYEAVPGTRIEKAPKLENNGNKDEYVFMRITVPKAQVTLLNEADDPLDDTVKKGMPKTGLSGAQQLFRFIADTPAAPAADNVAGIAAAAGRDIDFSYHSDKDSGSNTVEGWMLLDTYTVTSNSAYDEYVFGYNKKMLPNDVTKTLFDDVQLKSFIDSEARDGFDIGVYCYGIQADYLKPEGNVSFSAAYLDEAALNAVYGIVKNKAGLS